jgi:4'-phosphopantetheinyl transferase
LIVDLPQWDWREADRVRPLELNNTDIWLVNLKSREPTQVAFWSHLSEREHKRADRYKHEGAREEYIVSRATLRLLLARYVDDDPFALTFGQASRGKPYLIEIPGKPVPQFNMTHSHGVALYAFSLDPVGVDVEMVSRRANAEGLAKRYFTVRESEAILDLAPELRKEAFIRTWTCKEACLKWTGTGLSGGLKTHEIMFSDSWTDPVANGAPPQPVLTMLDPGAGWVGSLATDGPQESVNCYVWVESSEVEKEEAVR